MRKRDVEILCELLKNAKISDRDLARKMNISQSTVTRIRHKLEKREIVAYGGIPNFPSLNINLFAITLVRCTKLKKQAIKKFKSFVKENPKIIFIGQGNGMGKTDIIATLHSDFSDYMTFLKSFRMKTEGIVESIESFLVSTVNFPLKIGFGKAVECILKEEKEEKKSGTKNCYYRNQINFSSKIKSNPF